MNLFFCAHISQPISNLNQDESHHCVRVMRMVAGDEIHLYDGRGSKAVGTIAVANKKQVEVSVTEISFTEPPGNQIEIAIAPTKQNDRMEWFLEKATELGVEAIHLITTNHSERRQVNHERFERILLTAAKQSLCNYLPALHPLQPLKDFLAGTNKADGKYIATLLNEENAFEEFQRKQGKSLLLIGPEGGFTDAEVLLATKQGFKAVSLGSKRLRTETAGVFGVMVNYLKHSVS